MRKARSPHHFAYQKSNVSFPVFPVPNKCIFIWGAMFGHTCFYKEMWFKYEKRTRLSIKIYTYIYIYVCVCSYICSYVLRNAASSSGSRGQRSDSHVDQRTPLRAGPNLPNNKEKRWGRHWTSSNTSPESPPKQRR